MIARAFEITVHQEHAISTALHHQLFRMHEQVVLGAKGLIEEKVPIAMHQVHACATRAKARERRQELLRGRQLRVCRPHPGIDQIPQHYEMTHGTQRVTPRHELVRSTSLG